MLPRPLDLNKWSSCHPVGLAFSPVRPRSPPDLATMTLPPSAPFPSPPPRPPTGWKKMVCLDLDPFVPGRSLGPGRQRVRRPRSFLAATITTCTSCCLCGLPWIACCKPCPTGTEEACPSIGQSDNFKMYLASLFFNTNNDTIRNLYSAGTDDEFHFSSMPVFFGASYFLGIFFSYIWPCFAVWSFCAGYF
jgi:hypothetical protein